MQKLKKYVYTGRYINMERDNNKLILVDHFGISLSQMTMRGYVPLVVNRSQFFPHSRLITKFVTRLTRRVTLVEQELLTLPEDLSSLRFLVGFEFLDL